MYIFKGSNTVVTFCYPSSDTAHGVALIEDILDQVPENEQIGFAGFDKKEQLKEYFLEKFSSSPEAQFNVITKDDMEHISKRIDGVGKICAEYFDPEAITHVFIFPWIGGTYDDAFGGVTGFTPYVDTIHLYISTEKYTDRAIEETFAHEYNHSVFFRNHTLVYKLSESMVFEGMADVFREDSIGGEASAWSVALSELEQKNTWAELGEDVSSDSYELYNDVFFGSEKYKKWSGYSIGYSIVKKYKIQNPEIPWSRFVKIEPEEIIKASEFFSLNKRKGATS